MAASEIVKNIENGQWTASQVVEAYIARAAFTHQFTNCLTEGKPVVILHSVFMPLNGHHNSFVRSSSKRSRSARPGIFQDEEVTRSLTRRSIQLQRPVCAIEALTYSKS